MTHSRCADSQLRGGVFKAPQPAPEIALATAATAVRKLKGDATNLRNGCAHVAALLTLWVGELDILVVRNEDDFPVRVGPIRLAQGQLYRHDVSQ